MNPVLSGETRCLATLNVPEREDDLLSSMLTIHLGEQDRAIPPWQQRKLLDILPNARQIMVPDSGHLTYLERPDIFWPAAKAFFAAKSTRFDVGTAQSV